MSSNHIFFLQEVINDLIKTDGSIEPALFKLNYFARLIKNQELLDYTDAEINGYKGKEPPGYRKAIATLTVTLQSGAYSQIKEVPISMLEEPFNTHFLYQGVYEGIKVIESMGLKSHKNDSPLIRVDLPLEMIPYIQPAALKLYRSNISIQVVGAMITANANIIIQIPSTVKSKLLAFCMELADHFGYDIEIKSFNEKQTVNNHFVTNYIKNEITNNGDGNVNNTGNDSNLEATIAVKAPD
ncbi:AbiTii domain-containing protein [Pedobacter hiemivivus]|uniref:AbiTii domain-containing protein n=1 Tax=Pedobacter hiemivivus TaxID=2530454 RepID=A0A4V2MKL4_9SPHI|nr:hypothetical protein [Pedobacter hiemivivus]TCC98506.1 hypothetical protein EZ444_04275 [Pedobacter hiemivivus]